MLGSVVPSDMSVLVVSKVPVLFVKTNAFAAVVTPTVIKRSLPKPFTPRAAVRVSPT